MLLLCSICHILFAASTVELQLPEETLDNRETVLRRLITIITIIVITIITVTIITIIIRLKIDWVAGKVSELLAVRIIRPHFVTTSVWIIITLSQHQFAARQRSAFYNLALFKVCFKDLLFTIIQGHLFHFHSAQHRHSSQSESLKIILRQLAQQINNKQCSKSL